jgi:predicted phosphodiesterase
VRLGIMSDIHGNRVALEAVLADGVECGVDQWLALGDLVAVGPDPIGTLELLVSVPGLAATRGNTDRYVCSGERPPPVAADVAANPSLRQLFDAVEASFAWTRDRLNADALSYLEALPLELRTVLDDGTRLLGVHASPGRDDGHGITPHRGDEELRADLADADADVVIAGHTHQPTDRTIGRVRALNGGSVSNPVTDDLRASYFVVDPEAGFVHRRVSYDRDAFLASLTVTDHPQAEYIASFQRGEQIKHPAVRPGAPGG